MKENRARGVHGLDPGDKCCALPNKTIEGLAKVMQAVEESLAALNTDPRQRCGLAGQTKWSWRQAYHTYRALLRHIHGRLHK